MSDLRPVEPTAVDVIRAWIEKYLEDLHTAFPGRVQSYDSLSLTASVQPTVRHAVLQPDATYVYEQMPVLPRVPVMFPRSGNWGVVWPLELGDSVLVLCAESSLSDWRAGSGDPADPLDPRRFDLSHAVCVPGLFPSRTGFQRSSPSDMVVGHATSDAVITLKGDGTIELSGNTSFVALSDMVDDRLKTIRDQYNIHTHASSGSAPVPLIGLLDTTAATKVRAK